MSSHHEPSPDTTVIGIPALSRFADQRPLGQEEIAAIKALPAGSALLIAQDETHAAGRFLLDPERHRDQGGEPADIAGRHPDSDIFLDDVTVSRHHAEFRVEDGRFLLIDANSLNGTYVNGDRIDSVTLNTGDEVRIGKFAFVFYAPEQD